MRVKRVNPRLRAARLTNLHHLNARHERAALRWNGAYFVGPYADVHRTTALPDREIPAVLVWRQLNVAKANGRIAGIGLIICGELEWSPDREYDSECFQHFEKAA